MIELIIVVAIVGVISAIAIPRLSGFTERAETSSIAESLQRQEQAFLLYYAKNGEWPKDVTPGLVPPEMADYLDDKDMAGSPLGGQYDWQEWESIGYGPGGVHVSIIYVRDWSAARKIDEQIDDGNLNTGSVYRYNQYLLLTLEK